MVGWILEEWSKMIKFLLKQHKIETKLSQNCTHFVKLNLLGWKLNKMGILFLIKNTIVFMYLQISKCLKDIFLWNRMLVIYANLTITDLRGLSKDLTFLAVTLFQIILGILWNNQNINKWWKSFERDKPKSRPKKKKRNFKIQCLCGGSFSKLLLLQNKWEMELLFDLALFLISFSEYI